ncbi:MAG: iron-only hydrogenase system regulator [Oscillospiraceae bacterium]|nr:iron-only hydrogenase system regulator [Oscillospiraceae bacterium]
MESRVAIIGIIVENQEITGRLNEILHQYSDHIIGRMGLPHREKGISVICVVLDAPQDTISALSGKLGMLPQVSTKTIYSKPGSENTDERGAQA